MMSHPRIPRDIRCHHEYQALVHELAGDKLAAEWIFWHLWTDLAYQAQMFGVAGLFKRTEAGQFAMSVELPSLPSLNAEKLIELLLKARILARKGEDFFCPIFADLNHELDADFAVSKNPCRKFHEVYSQAIEVSPGICAKLAARSWDRGDGTPATTDEMETAVALIKVVDHLLKLEDRPPEQFGPGLVQAALRVVIGYPTAKLNAVLRRWYHRWRTMSKHDLWRFPRTAEECLTQFKDIEFWLMPEGGWERTHQ
jgi:hypothetical protein